MRESGFDRLQAEIKAMRAALALLERRRDAILDALAASDDADAADAADAPGAKGDT